MTLLLRLNEGIDSFAFNIWVIQFRLNDLGPGFYGFIKMGLYLILLEYYFGEEHRAYSNAQLLGKTRAGNQGMESQLWLQNENEASSEHFCIFNCALIIFLSLRNLQDKGFNAVSATSTKLAILTSWWELLIERCEKAPLLFWGKLNACIVVQSPDWERPTFSIPN